MKIKLLLLSAFSIFIINTVYSQSSYKQYWKKVVSFEGKVRPKSAMKIVEKIYIKAKKENNSPQFIKSLIYRLKYKNMLKDISYAKLIIELDSVCKKAKFPENAIMHSMLADMYWQYYQNNHTKFLNRTNTEKLNSSDIETWTLEYLVDKTIKEHKLSLVNSEKLQTISVSEYRLLINQGTKPKELRPTLYDFIANKAINFFSNTQASLTRPIDYFSVKEKYYFSNVSDFVKIKIQTNDTLSLLYHAVRLYQDLLNFRHGRKNDENALIDIELSFIKFVYRRTLNETKNELYQKALERLEKKYINNPFSAEISYELANFYMQQSTKYNLYRKETHKYKTYKRKAYDICKKVIDKYPKSNASEFCRQLINRHEFHNKNMNFQVETVVSSKNKFLLKLNYQNIDSVFIRIAKIEREEFKNINEKIRNRDLRYEKIIKKTVTVREYSQMLPENIDLDAHSAELLIDKLPVGFYVIFASANEDFTYKESICAYKEITVSDIWYIKQSPFNGSCNFILLDRTTGYPIEEVSAQTWYRKYDYDKRKYIRVDGKKYLSDKTGSININNNQYRNVDFSKGEDFNTTTVTYNHGYRESLRTYTYFFTDRKIYRPGQTVYFKGIVMDSDFDSNKIRTEYKTTVSFHDVNGQKKSSLEVTTNEYGTFSGSFQIPKGLLNGNFSIRGPGGSIQISVEEYKRPKFEVEMLPFSGIYILNDSIKLKGKAVSFSGAGLTDADVKYRIVRTPKWSGWRYRHYYSGSSEITNGKIKTTDSGEFEICFVAKPDRQNEKNEFISFNYQIFVDVTDINGETHSLSETIRVGWRALEVSLPVKKLINKNDPIYLNKNTSKINISTLNLNGEFITAKGDIKIYKLKDNSHAVRNRLWKKPDKHLYSKTEWYKISPCNVYDDENDIRNLDTLELIRSLTFDTEKNKEADVSFFKDLSTGHYTIEIFSKDTFGNPVSNKYFFSIYSEKEEQMPFKTKDFFVSVKPICEPGEEAMFLIGTSDSNVRVLYEVEHKGKIVSSEVFMLNNEQRLIKHLVEEKHRGNFSVHFVFVRDNRIFNHSTTVTVPYSNKKLDLEFSSFRNKLYPGENEKWKIKIKGPKGEKVAAEMLATLYDASLDKFRANKWNFNIYKTFNIQRSWKTQKLSFVSSNVLNYNYYRYKYYNPKTLFYDTFNWFGFYNNNKLNCNYLYDSDSVKVINVQMKTSDAKLDEVVVTGYGVSREKKSLGYAVSEIKADDLLESEDSDTEEKEENNKKVLRDRKFSKVKVRTNFNETAFFYPHLQTNKEGDIIVEFSIPESLTKWKMMGMGVTKDLKYGFIENELITQKEIMILPNVPRFFREFDKITFPVKISNVSEKNLKGKVRLELFDAFTMEPVVGIFQNNEQNIKKFSVKSGSNTVIKWNLEIPDGLGAVTYKIVAKTRKFSDGEQNAIPVLSNRMLVTESLPLPVRGNQSKDYKFKKLIESDTSSTLKHHKLTLEFTSNPAWYAVQSLPYLIEYPYGCNEQIFSRYFASSLAAHIANSDPKIKKVFESWANTPDSEALLSNLEKNQELKSVLLQETPWVVQGKNETQRKKRIGMMFDLKKLSDAFGKALSTLQRRQVSNGGWPWFTGGPESRYITQHIVTGMGYLDALGAGNVRKDSKTFYMIKRAVSYLDIRIVEDYRRLKKDTTEGFMDRNHLSYDAVNYLYGRSFFKDIQMSKRTKKAYDYYMGQAKKYWKTQSQYMQGMIALALHRENAAKTGIHTEHKIVESLKERSTNHEEYGMYWKNNVGGWYWYNAPIEMQALMIEVFDEIADDKKSVNDMKIWLLKQKQTQDWRTTKATVLAVYALLKRGADWLASDELVEIKMNNKIIDPKEIEGTDIEAGTGYFKTSWNEVEIKPGMGNVTITKKDEGVSWGALYWQYFENLDKITPHETPLKIKKQLFVEKFTDKERVLEAINDKNKLKIGDKVIVRIELRSDRLMEYIHMKDMRASGFEPINVISRYKYQGRLGYYESTKDAATNFFIGRLPKGTFVFEYPLRVAHKGDFSNGITTIQCMYAPEFTAHSEGIRVKVDM